LLNWWNSWKPPLLELEKGALAAIEWAANAKDELDVHAARSAQRARVVPDPCTTVKVRRDAQDAD
jgi:hypothetical protein